MHFLTHSTLSRSACQTANSTRYLQLFQALQIAKIASAQAAQTIACQNSVERERESEKERAMKMRGKIEARKSIYYCLPQFSRNVILMCHADLRAGLISQGKMPEYAAIVPCHLDTWVAATHLNPSPTPPLHCPGFAWPCQQTMGQAKVAKTKCSNSCAYGWA